MLSRSTLTLPAARARPAAVRATFLLPEGLMATMRRGVHRFGVSIRDDGLVEVLAPCSDEAIGIIAAYLVGPSLDWSTEFAVTVLITSTDRPRHRDTVRLRLARGRVVEASAATLSAPRRLTGRDARGRFASPLGQPGPPRSQSTTAKIDQNGRPSTVTGQGRGRSLRASQPLSC